jgi:hypothetical protein
MQVTLSVYYYYLIHQLHRKIEDNIMLVKDYPNQPFNDVPSPFPRLKDLVIVWPINGTDDTIKSRLDKPSPNCCISTTLYRCDQ